MAAAAVKTNHVVIFLCVFTFSLMILGANGLTTSKIEGELTKLVDAEELKLISKKLLNSVPFQFLPPEAFWGTQVLIGSMTYNVHRNDQDTVDSLTRNCKKRIARMLLRERQGIPVHGEALRIGKNQYQPICPEEEQHQRLLLKENPEAYVKIYLKNVINPIELEKLNITY